MADVPSSAVTTTLSTLFPGIRLRVPKITTDAAGSVVMATAFTLSVFFGSVKVAPIVALCALMVKEARVLTLESGVT